MFFDTETDGNGTFRPFGQKVIQVSWTITTFTNRTLETFTTFVRGAAFLKFNPNGFTMDQIDAGAEPKEVAAAFSEAAERILANKGRFVAHNIDFDFSAIESLGLDVKRFRRRGFCTCQNSRGVCNIKNWRGKGYKLPKMQELYNFLFPESPLQQTHTANDDVDMLRACFFECRTRRHYPFLLCAHCFESVPKKQKALTNTCGFYKCATC